MFAVLMLLALGAAPEEGPAGSVKAVEEAVCRWTGTPPVLDGKLDDPAWKSAVALDDFPTFWQGLPSLKHPKRAGGYTQARLLWDDENLYYAADMYDANLFTYGTRRNDRLWEGDVFELFFKPREDGPRYYEFQVNPKSLILELPFPRRGHSFDELAAGPALGMEVAVRLKGTPDDFSDQDEGWSVEGKVPWKVFQATGGRPAPGAVWRFALCRYDYGPPGTKPLLFSCAPLTVGSFHRYEDYSRLRFEKAEP